MTEADKLRQITQEVKTKLLAERKAKDDANLKKLVDDVYRFALETAGSAARKGQNCVPDIYRFTSTDRDGRDQSDCYMTASAIIEKLKSEGFQGKLVSEQVTTGPSAATTSLQWHWRVEMWW